MKRGMRALSRLLQRFPRLEYEYAVTARKAEPHARGFSSWSQFVAMRVCRLGRAKSLRAICGGLACCEGTLGRLGIAAPQ